MKGKPDTRRGIAIELAVGVMLMMVALSILLVSAATLQNAHRKADLQDFSQTLTLYGITDHILANPTATAWGAYTITEENGSYTVLDPQGQVVLEITVENGTVTAWR